MNTPTPLLSVVVPAYNEQEVIDEFHQRITQVMQSLNMAWEVVYVNDGSHDQTLDKLRQLHSTDEHVCIVDLSRNFGKEIALSAGLAHTQGDAVVVIDADLQDPPELIPELIKEWQNGSDVVYARRTQRDGESFMKRFTAAVFYRLMRNVGRVKLPEDTGDFRLLSRRAVNALNTFKEQHRFMKGLFAWIGFKQKAVYYQRDARLAGTSKWSYWKLWNFALDGITSFTITPLKIATYIGIITSLCAFIYGTYMLVTTLMYGNPVPGYPSLIVIILFLGGVQLMAIGILGEYIGRIFTETKQRPLYFVNELLSTRQENTTTYSEQKTQY